MISVTLLEGLIILALTGIGVVGWWGIKRFVKISDDNAVALKNMHDVNVETLNKIYNQLTKTDTWIVLHDKQDDERYEMLKESQGHINTIFKKMGGGK